MDGRSRPSTPGKKEGVGVRVSRRDFLKVVPGTSAGLAVAKVAAAAARDRFDEEIPVSRFRPRPSVKITAAILRRKPPYWLGWPGTSYDLEGHQKEYTEALLKAGRALGVHVDLAEEPVQDGPGLDSFIRRIKRESPHGVVVILQHLSCWNDANVIANAIGVPLIVFAPVGTAFTGHVRDFSRRTGVFVVSSLDFDGVAAGLRMIRAKRMYEATRILWIRGRERGESVMERLGITVRSLPRRVFNELFDRTPVTDEVRRIARFMQQDARRVVEPSWDDLLNAARTYVTAKRLLQQERANALSMDCLGMVGQRLVPTPPCMAWSLFQDAGITAGCEADLFAAVSLMLPSYLFDRPGFINDPVPETEHNELITAHCTCGTRLNGFDKPPEPFILRSHSESDAGVAMQVLWKVGQPVTLVRFANPHELNVDTGVVAGNVDTPPAGGCRTSVRIRMNGVRDSRDVRGFHQVVFYGDWQRRVESFCQLYGIRVTHSA